MSIENKFENMEAGQEKTEEEKKSAIENFIHKAWRSGLRSEGPKGEHKGAGSAILDWFDETVSQLFVDAQSFRDFKKELLASVKPALEEKYKQKLMKPGMERRIYNKILSDLIAMPDDQLLYESSEKSQ